MYPPPVLKPHRDGDDRRLPTPAGWSPLLRGKDGDCGERQRARYRASFIASTSGIGALTPASAGIIMPKDFEGKLSAVLHQAFIPI